MGNRTNLLCDSFSSGSSFRGTPERKRRTFKSSLVPVRAVRARGPQRSKVDKETKKARPPKLTVKGKLPYVPTGACPKEGVEQLPRLMRLMRSRTVTDLPERAALAKRFPDRA